jgi:hypothetical protein
MIAPRRTAPSPRRTRAPPDRDPTLAPRLHRRLPQHPPIVRPRPGARAEKLGRSGEHRSSTLRSTVAERGLLLRPGSGTRAASRRFEPSEACAARACRTGLARGCVRVVLPDWDRGRHGGILSARCRPLAGLAGEPSRLAGGRLAGARKEEDGRTDQPQPRSGPQGSTLPRLDRRPTPPPRLRHLLPAIHSTPTTQRLVEAEYRHRRAVTRRGSHASRRGRRARARASRRPVQSRLRRLCDHRGALRSRSCAARRPERARDVREAKPPEPLRHPLSDWHRQAARNPKTPHHTFRRDAHPGETIYPQDRT